MHDQQEEADPRIAEYICGYQEQPEDPAEAQAMVEAWADGVEPDEWL